MKHFRSLSQSVNKRVLFTAATFLFASGILNAQPVKTYDQIAADHPDWVQVPGELIRPDCVHEIPHGAKVEVGQNGKPTGDVTLKGQVVGHFDACSENAIRTRPHSNAKNSNAPPPLPCEGEGCKTPPPNYNYAIPIYGWVEDSQWNVPISAGDNIDAMYGYWQVPSVPWNSYAAAPGPPPTGLIYIFNGISDSSEDWILQPVLQYGFSPAGGGRYWAIASWYVCNCGYVFYSPLVTVNPGDLIYGQTKMTGTSGSTLDYGVVAYDLSTGWDSWITVGTAGVQWSWAYSGVLEAYNIDYCSWLPSSGQVDFQGQTVTHGYPNYNTFPTLGWSSNIPADLYPQGEQGVECGFSVSPGTATTLSWEDYCTQNAPYCIDGVPQYPKE